MNYFGEFITVVTVHFLAVMSPGPDFILITRNSLKYSRVSGIYSALGLGLGIMVHVTYCLVGIGYLISKSILLFNIIKFIGAAYIFYIGVKSLVTKVSHIRLQKTNKESHISNKTAIKMGFITNVTNPKATLFFLALFSQVINPFTPNVIKVIYGVEMSMATFLWFAFVAYIFTHKVIKSRVEKIQFWAERLMGIILILLALKLVFSA